MEHVDPGAPPERAARALQRALLEERVQQHRDAGLSSVLASAVLAVGLAALLWPFQPAWLPLGALALLAATQAARLAVSRGAGRAPDAAALLLRFRAAALAHGIAWGLYAVALIKATDAAAGVEIVGFAVGVLAAGALVTTGFDLLAAGGFLLLAAGPVVPFVLAGVQGRELSAEAAMLAVVGLFGALHARRHMVQTARRRVDESARAADVQRLAEAAETARRSAAEQNHLLDLLLATTTEGFWFIDTSGVTRDLNPAMCRLLGRAREDVLGRAALEFFEGESLATLRAQIERRRLGETGTYEAEIRRPDGTVVHCVNAATPIYEVDGRQAGSVGIWTDISARRRAEQVLHTYERVAQSISDPVSVMGEDRVYRMVNDAWCRATGIAREQALGRRSDAVLPGAYNESRMRAWNECMMLREPRSVIATVDTPGLAGRIVETTYYPYDDPAGQRAVVTVSRDVTERETARRDLAESAEYLRRTLNATGDGIFASDASDPSQPVLFANEQMLRIWGIAPDKHATLTPADIMAAAVPLFADPDHEARRVAEIVTGNLPDESRLRLRDGRVIVRRCIPARVDGRTIRVWSFRDITAEARVLEDARGREAEQRALLDAIPAFIGRVDADGVYTYVNDRLAALCGTTREALLGRRFDAVDDPARLAPLRALLGQALRGQAATIEYRHAPDARRPATDVQVTVVPGVHPGTGALAVYGFGIDISDLKRTQESLRNEQAELRALLSAFPGYIATVDQSLTYHFVNDSLARRLGRPADEVVGHCIPDLLGPELGAVIGAEIAAAAAGQVTRTDRHYPARGDLPALDLSLTHVAGPPRDDGSRIFYTFGIDITARKRAEQALVAARDEAERANRAKSQFLSQMSHELRTPLNAILGLGQLLASDTRQPLPASQQGFVDEMLRGARHLLDLINDVLDLGTVEAGRLGLDPQPVALESLVAECVALVRPVAESSDVHLTTGPIGGLAARADRRRLKQVLLNLLSNSIKYNRRPGSVRIECRRDGEKVRIGVRDTGRGIAAHDLTRLFQPFERLEPTRHDVEGTGIGLALSRRLVEAMGGTLEVESEVGVGSVFSISMPASADQAPALAAPRVAAAVAAPVEGAPLVLYIEDNPINVFVMEALFERLPGYRLHCAQTPAEGLQVARAEHPALILLDVQLPEMNGPEVLQRLRARADTRDIAVVAVSASAMADDVAEMIDAGAAAYVTKPIELDALVDAVRRHARGGGAELVRH